MPGVKSDFSLYSIVSLFDSQKTCTQSPSVYQVNVFSIGHRSWKLLDWQVMLSPTHMLLRWRRVGRFKVQTDMSLHTVKSAGVSVCKSVVTKEEMERTDRKWTDRQNKTTERRGRKRWIREESSEVD